MADQPTEHGSEDEKGHPLFSLLEEPKLTLEECLRLSPTSDASQGFEYSRYMVKDGLSHYAQFGCLAEAFWILEWNFVPTSMAFINEDYRVGFMLEPGEMDERMNGGFMILGPDDDPVKGTHWDVFRIKKHPKSGIWNKDAREDRWYLNKSESGFNGGAVLEHPAAMAYNIVMAEGNPAYVVCGSSSIVTYLTKAYARTLSRANGHLSDDFKTGWARLHSSEG